MGNKASRSSGSHHNNDRIGTTKISLDAKCKFKKADLRLLNTLFHELETGSQHTIEKSTFLSLFPCSGLLAERLYLQFDSDQDNAISYPEFINGISNFVKGDRHERTKLLFDMYDFEKEGTLTRENLALMLHSLIDTELLDEYNDNLDEVRETMYNSSTTETPLTYCFDTKVLTEGSSVHGLDEAKTRRNTGINRTQFMVDAYQNQINCSGAKQPPTIIEGDDYEDIDEYSIISKNTESKKGKKHVTIDDDAVCCDHMSDCGSISSHSTHQSSHDPDDQADIINHDKMIPEVRVPPKSALKHTPVYDNYADERISQHSDEVDPIHPPSHGIKNRQNYSLSNHSEHSSHATSPTPPTGVSHDTISLLHIQNSKDNLPPPSIHSHNSNQLHHLQLSTELIPSDDHQPGPFNSLLDENDDLFTNDLERQRIEILLRQLHDPTEQHINIIHEITIAAQIGVEQEKFVIDRIVEHAFNVANLRLGHDHMSFDCFEKWVSRYPSILDALDEVLDRLNWNDPRTMQERGDLGHQNNFEQLQPKVIQPQRLNCLNCGFSVRHCLYCGSQLSLDDSRTFSVCSNSTTGLCGNFSTLTLQFKFCLQCGDPMQDIPSQPGTASVTQTLDPNHDDTILLDLEREPITHLPHDSLKRSPTNMTVSSDASLDTADYGHNIVCQFSEASNPDPNVHHSPHQTKRGLALTHVTPSQHFPSNTIGIDQSTPHNTPHEGLSQHINHCPTSAGSTGGVRGSQARPQLQREQQTRQSNHFMPQNQQYSQSPIPSHQHVHTTGSTSLSRASSIQHSTAQSHDPLQSPSPHIHPNQQALSSLASLHKLQTTHKSLHHDSHTKQVMHYEGQVSLRTTGLIKHFKQRWCLLRGGFLYFFRARYDTDPSFIIFLEGSFITPQEGDEHENSNLYAFEIKTKTHRHMIYVKTIEQRQTWVKLLRQASKTQSIEEFYSFKKQIGKGKFATVYEATNHHNGRAYAVKVVSKVLMERQQEQDALRAEIAILKSLSHPNIIHLKEVYQDEHNIYMVMPLIKEGDLFDRIILRKTFPEETVRVMMWKLLNALEYLHDKGIVHCDVKPENILMADSEDDTKVILADFGLSAFYDPAHGMCKQQGTISYVAPEVLRGEQYTKQIDIYGLGVCCYVLLCGELPFQGYSQNEIIQETLRGDLVFTAPEWDECISPEARAFVTRLLAKDPKERLTATESLNEPWFERIRKREAEQSARINLTLLRRNYSSHSQLAQSSPYPGSSFPSPHPSNLGHNSVFSSPVMPNLMFSGQNGGSNNTPIMTNHARQPSSQQHNNFLNNDPITPTGILNINLASPDLVSPHSTPNSLQQSASMRSNNSNPVDNPQHISLNSHNSANTVTIASLPLSQHSSNTTNTPENSHFGAQ